MHNISNLFYFGTTLYIQTPDDDGETVRNM